MNRENDKTKKILLVEDEQILGGLISEKLGAEGYEVFWELDGEKGIQKMRAALPDLVLLDLGMPKKNGYEVLEEIEKDDLLKKIPVVIISNSGQPLELSRALKLGVKDYIIKAEFSPDDVLKKVRKYLDSGQTTDAGPKKGTSDIKILVTEDDQFLHSLIMERLAKEGYTLLAAMDGIEALKILETELPDVLILDIVMPGINGFEVLKKVKSDPKYKNMSVIIFSNLGQEHEIEEARALGADEFLVKARFTLKEVVEKINALLKKKGRISA